MAVDGEHPSTEKSVYGRPPVQIEKARTLLDGGAVQVDTRMKAGEGAKKIVHTQPAMKPASPTKMGK